MTDSMTMTAMCSPVFQPKTTVGEAIDAVASIDRNIREARERIEILARERVKLAEDLSYHFRGPFESRHKIVIHKGKAYKFDGHDDKLVAFDIEHSADQ